MWQPSFAKAGTRDVGSFEVKVHSSPVTIMSHMKPGYKVAENVGLF